MDLASGEARLIRSEIRHKSCDFFRRRDAAHRLAGDEIRQSLFVIAGGAQPVMQGRAVHRAGADGIASNALGDEIGSNGLGQSHDGRL